jgi:phosphate starvation-inducible membrane PsiE
MLELLVLAALILVMVISIYLLRRSKRAIEKHP